MANGPMPIFVFRGSIAGDFKLIAGLVNGSTARRFTVAANPVSVFASTAVHSSVCR